MQTTMSKNKLTKRNPSRRVLRQNAIDRSKNKDRPSDVELEQAHSVREVESNPDRVLDRIF